MIPPISCHHWRSRQQNLSLQTKWISRKWILYLLEERLCWLLSTSLEIPPSRMLMSSQYSELLNWRSFDLWVHRILFLPSLATIFLRKLFLLSRRAIKISLNPVAKIRHLSTWLLFRSHPAACLLLASLPWWNPEQWIGLSLISLLIRWWTTTHQSSFWKISKLTLRSCLRYMFSLFVLSHGYHRPSHSRRRVVDYHLWLSFGYIFISAVCVVKERVVPYLIAIP